MAVFGSTPDPSLPPLRVPHLQVQLAQLENRPRIPRFSRAIASAAGIRVFVMSVIAVPAVISLGTFISVLFNACREGFGI